LQLQEPLDLNRLGRRRSPAEEYLRKKPWIQADAVLHLFLIIGGFAFAGFVLMLLTCASR